MSNVVADQDKFESIIPDKERAENKIDAAVALIMAMSRALVGNAKGSSIYSTRGLLMV
jgi:phage terminase large subunit-like protein